MIEPPLYPSEEGEGGFLLFGDGERGNFSLQLGRRELGKRKKREIIYISWRKKLTCEERGKRRGFVSLSFHFPLSFWEKEKIEGGEETEVKVFLFGGRGGS